MANVKLRPPHIAELIHSLKHKDKLPFDKLPLTIGEARREILKVASKSKD
jgi:cobalt/nickel transport system ATP-binding protein